MSRGYNARMGQLFGWEKDERLSEGKRIVSDRQRKIVLCKGAVGFSYIVESYSKKG